MWKQILQLSSPPGLGDEGNKGSILNEWTVTIPMFQGLMRLLKCDILNLNADICSIHNRHKNWYLQLTRVQQHIIFMLTCFIFVAGFSSPPKDCADIRAAGLSESGVYVINLANSNNESSVYCDMNSSESWLVIHWRNNKLIFVHSIVELQNPNHTFQQNPVNRS